MSQITDLNLVVALAEERHFGKAAERCHLSSSAMTRAIQRLEAQLDVALFERDNRSVTLTEQGKLYLNYARRAQNEWAILQTQLHSAGDKLKGELSLYCSVTAVYSLLRPLVQQCRRQYPDIELRLHTGDQADAVQRILEHREHIAIAACPSKLPDSLEFQPLALSPFVLIQPTLSNVKIAPDDPVDWAHVPVIVAERGVGRERMDAFFKHKQIKPNIYATVTGHEAIVTMVALGFGIGGVPEIVVDASPQRDQIQILAGETPITPFNIGLICHKRHKQNAVVNAFWQLGAQL